MREWAPYTYSRFIPTPLKERYYHESPEACAYMHAVHWIDNRHSVSGQIHFRRMVIFSRRFSINNLGNIIAYDVMVECFYISDTSRTRHTSWRHDRGILCRIYFSHLPKKENIAGFPWPTDILRPPAGQKLSN
jgi:hypothetical protein